MSGALRDYAMTSGAALSRDGDVAEVVARAERLVDAQRVTHREVYGHWPGEVRADGEKCTLPDREGALAAVTAQLAAAERRCVIPPGVTTAEAQDIVRRTMPWAWVPDPTVDPEVNRARRHLAEQVAGLRPAAQPPPGLWTA